MAVIAGTCRGLPRPGPRTIAIWNSPARLLLRPAQCLGLAQKSLRFRHHGGNPGRRSQPKLPDLYNNELAEHREAIISLLELRQQQNYRTSTSATSPWVRRHVAVPCCGWKRSASRLALHKGPIIAAGSTGTIPATRELLAAISRHPQGAVILPGLDLLADEASWAFLPQEHPQYRLEAIAGQSRDPAQ